MAIRKHRGIWAVAVLAACGGNGGGGDGGAAPVAPPDPVPQPISLQTSVGMDALTYKIPALTDCLQATDALKLPVLGPDFKADGDLADWAHIPAYLDDPAGSAPAGAALAGVAVAATQAGDALAVAAPMRPAANVSLNFEWGGIAVQQGTAHAEVRRILRVYQGVLQDFESGTWQPVAPELGQLALGQGGTEAVFSRRLLGDVVTWPLWWLRVFTRDETASTGVASTMAAYFPSVLGVDHAPFAVSDCELWAGRSVPLGLFQVSDGVAPDPAANAPPNTDWVGVAARAFQLTRAAYNAVQDTLAASPLPTSRLAVLATANNLSSLVDATGIGASYLGSGQLYRAIMLDLKPLAPSTTLGFPEGPIFDQAAAAFLDLYLQNQLPSAPQPLVQTVRRALLDRLDQKFLSMAYALDNLPFDVASVLATAPTPGPLTDPKVVPFGHLLGSELAPKPLLAAWRHAAVLVAGGTSDPAMALRDALVSGAFPDTALADRVTRLWHGWATPDAFDAAYAPSVLGDTDGDGLPDFLEGKYGTDKTKQDTNADGWSDATKVELGIDPLTGPPPGVIVPDNDFGDWQILLPKRLVLGKGIPNGQCPKAATIGYYAAIASHDTLMIGAYAADYLAGEPAARWEVDFDFATDKRQVHLTAAGGGHSYELRDATSKAVIKSYRRAAPFGQRTFKVAISRLALGLATNLDAPAAVKVQMRTVYTDKAGDHFCDETDWIAPYTTSE